MNCDCISDTAVKLLDRLSLPEASKPHKDAEVRSVTCAHEGIAGDGTYIVQVPFTVRWQVPDGRMIVREVPVRMNFCPFCGQSAAKPSKLRKAVKEKMSAKPVQPLPPAGEGF